MFSIKALIAISALSQSVFALPASSSSIDTSLNLAKRGITGATFQMMECPDVDDTEEFATKKAYFNNWQVEDAITDALKHAPPTTGNGYSKRWRNSEGLATACGGCDDGENVCYEYPLMLSGKNYGGSGDPLGFRVTFKTSAFGSENAQYCAVVYHPRDSSGNSLGSFAACNVQS